MLTPTQQTTPFSSNYPNGSEVVNALTHMRDVLAALGDIRDPLHGLCQKAATLLPETRIIKIHDRHRGDARNVRVVPEIQLAGEWLKKIGFTLDMRVQVISLHGLLIICPEKRIGDDKKNNHEATS